jgi:hypothetical protein
LSQLVISTDDGRQVDGRLLLYVQMYEKRKYLDRNLISGKKAIIWQQSHGLGKGVDVLQTTR